MSIMDFQYRYYFEHTYLPKMLSGRGAKVELIEIEMLQGYKLVTMVDNIGMRNGFKCPYDASNYTVTTETVKSHGNMPEYTVLTIKMPPPEQATLCSHVYICYEKDMENIRYYTLELSFDDRYVLGGWDGNGVHYNYGTAPETGKSCFDKVCNLYESHIQG